MMPEDFFKKNMEMWEQYSTTYMDTMFKTMERTMQQSQALQDQLNEMVEKSVSAQTEASLAMLNSIQKQLEMLTDKVDQLVKEAEADQQ